MIYIMILFIFTYIAHHNIAPPLLELISFVLILVLYLTNSKNNFIIPKLMNVGVVHIEQTESFTYLQAPVDNCLHGKAAVLSLTNSCNNSVKTTVQNISLMYVHTLIAFIYGTPYSLYHVSLV